MNIAGWTSWGWYKPGGNGFDEADQPLRRWKWYGREDVFVETNDHEVLIFLAGSMTELQELNE
jgi:hypothetical protein